MIRITDFNKSNELVVYRGNDYDSYEEAHKDGADYRTGSTIDNLKVESGTVIGQDTFVIISSIAECLGTENLIAGIINIHGEFVEIPFYLSD